MTRPTAADRAYTDWIAATLMRLEGLDAAWLWWMVGRGLRARRRGLD